MAKRAEKEAVVAGLQEKLDGAKSVVITDYRGLNVADMNELRSRLREAGVDYQVVKNTLARLAVQDRPYEGDLQEYLTGPTAIAFSMDDAVAAAKTLAEFAGEHEALEIKSGILDGQVIPLERVQALAELPSREELLTQVAVALKSPLQGMANVLSAPLREFATVVDALRKERAEAAS